MNRTEALEKTGEQVARKTEDLAQRAGEKSREIADTVGDKAQRVSEKAREVAENVGERIAGASDTIQGKLRETGKEVGEVVSAVSDKVRSSAQYLEESSMQEVVEDVTTLIKRYPIHAVIIGAGIGFLLARGRSR